jgi:hypothetical protein
MVEVKLTIASTNFNASTFFATSKYFNSGEMSFFFSLGAGPSFFQTLGSEMKSLTW